MVIVTNVTSALNSTATASSTTQHETDKESPVPAQQLQSERVHCNNRMKVTKAPSSIFFICVRSILLDIPLALLFLSFLVMYGVHEIHNEYYVPLMERALRTDTDLLDEITYYERSCTQYDLSTRNIQDLVMKNQQHDKHEHRNDTQSMSMTTAASSVSHRHQHAANTEDHVDQMMTHGAMVIPEVLSEQAVQDLRAYIVRRNAAVTDAEAYPVSQGSDGSRLSYGIDATEDPAVVRAVKEVANHSALRLLMQGLLGDVDPATAEITAITAYAGCPNQNWHQDTKADGNAIMYARTYSHSYSLFLPLQDTTAAMGATDICPGTHYCANNLEQMCDSNAMGLNEANPEQVFRAGDGGLLNQHIWHRGSAHTDPNASERIVFIMSFLARPKPEDPRQLSRGTYFHQKWNMWGHTWQDLLDPLKSMRQPFSTLRCLSLWKPARYNWGYDLVTSGFMRFVNNQLEDDDLETRFLPKLDQMHFPLWLRGRYLEDAPDQSTAWRTFIQETIENMYAFVTQVAVWVHGGYLGLVIVASLWSAWRYNTGIRVLLGTSFRMLLTHALLIGLAIKTLNGISTSDWGSNVLKGTTLMRPFPVVFIARDEAVMTSTGPTTLPQRSDVLIGTRLDADFLGSYDRWLDYHPGNAVFRQLVADVMASLHPAKNALQTEFGKRLVNVVVDQITKRDGRFLLQDYRTGDWRILSDGEALEIVQTEILAASSGVMAAIRKSIDHMIADYRFGELRTTRLASLAQVHLWQLRKLLLNSVPLKGASSIKSSSVLTPLSTGWRPRGPALKIRPSTPAATIPAYRRFSLPVKDNNAFQVGSAVECIFDGEDAWYPGIVMGFDEDSDSYSISFHDDTFEPQIPREQLRKFRPVQQNDDVLYCFPQDDECYTGTAVRVMPNADIQILFEGDNSDEFEDRVPAIYYSVQHKYYE